MYIGNTPFQGLVGGGNILDASIEGVDLSTSAIAARLGYTPVDPGAAAFTATLTAKDIQQDNATYIKGKLAAGTVTRLFGINSADTVYIGSIDANHTGGTLFVKNGVAQMTLDANSNLSVTSNISSKSSAINDQGIATYGSWTSIQENGFYDAGANFLHNAIKTSGVNDTWNYRFNNTATRYKMLNGVHSWYTAAGGAAAGTAISWNQAMTLDTAGRLLVGITSSTGANVKLVVGNGLTSSNAVAVINNYNTNIPALSISNWDGSTTSYGPRIAFDNSGRGGFTIGGSDGSNNFDIARTWGTPDLRIDSNGYVGINRTSVRTELDVTGRARFNSYLAIGRGPNNNDGLFWNITPNTAGTAYTPGYIGSTGAGSAYLGMPSGGNGGLMLKVKRHGTTATDYAESSMTLATYWDDSGNVGIGTIPTQKLHVSAGYGINSSNPATSGTTQNGILRLTPNAGTFGETLDFGMNIGPTYAWIQSTNWSGLETNYPLALNPNGGNVGIGTKAPNAKLHIGTETDPNITNQALFVQGSKSQYAGINGLTMGSLFVYDDTAGTAGSGGAISFGANTGSSQRTWIAAIESRRDSATTDASNYAGSLVFYTRPAQSPSEERMRITSAGNFLVGSTSNYNLRAIIAGPAATSSTGSGSYLVASLADTNAMAAGVGGGLGFQGNDGVNGLVTFASINGSKENSTSGNYASYLSFKTRANGQSLTERMTIASDGVITIPGGIKAKAPSYELYGSQYNEAGLDASKRIKLGTFYTAQGGMDTTIRLFVGAGYNAVAEQVSEYVLRLRTSNGSSSTAGSTGVLYINGFAEKVTIDGFGSSQPIESFLVEEINTGQYVVYIDPNSLIGNYSHYIVESGYTQTWVHTPEVVNISAITGNYLTVNAWRTRPLTNTSGFIDNIRGIKFPASAGYSTDPNSLDDYEEGTWNPTPGGLTSINYGYRLGSYVKVGKIVTVFWDFVVNTSGGSGTQMLYGLPFPVSSSQAGYSVVHHRDASIIATGPAGTELKGFAQIGDTYIALQLDWTGSSGWATQGPATYNNSGRHTGYCTYTTQD